MTIDDLQYSNGSVITWPVKCQWNYFQTIPKLQQLHQTLHNSCWNFNLFNVKKREKVRWRHIFVAFKIWFNFCICHFHCLLSVILYWAISKWDWNDIKYVQKSIVCKWHSIELDIWIVYHNQMLISLFRESSNNNFYLLNSFWLQAFLEFYCFWVTRINPVPTLFWQWCILCPCFKGHWRDFLANTSEPLTYMNQFLISGDSKLI